MRVLTIFDEILTRRNIIVIGLAIRILLAPFTAHPSDIGYWEEFGKALLTEQTNPYTGFVYPPPWILIIGAMYNLYLHFPSEFFLYLVLKIPIIIGDLLMGFVLYDVVEELSGSRKLANSALVLFLLNPYVIWISSVWGMFDVLPALCTLLSLRFYLKGNRKSSFLFLGLGAAFKYYPFLLLPVLLIYEWKKDRKIKQLFYMAFLTGLPITLASLPFILLYWESYFQTLFSTPLMLHELWSTPASYLSFIYVFRDVAPELFNQLMSNFWWSNALSYSIFLILYPLLLVKLYREDTQSPSWFLNHGFLMAILVIFMSSKMLNEQYFQWAVPFMIINFSVFNKKNGTLFKILCFAFFMFFTINVPIYNFIPDVYNKTFNYTAFLIPLVDFYENMVPGIVKSLSLFMLGLTITITCAIYYYRLMKQQANKI
jgi:Gpi18-like mannosyltransferase